MKILVLNGSPRANGNTAALTKAFKEGAEKKGHEVFLFSVANMNIQGCRACGYCQEHDGCVQKDDMQEIYPVIDSADMVVFASPVYFHGVTGQMQCAITRFYAKTPKMATKSALILSSGSPDMYDPMTIQYQRIIRFFKTEDMGIKTYAGVVGEKELEEISAFGESL